MARTRDRLLGLCVLGLLALGVLAALGNDASADDFTVTTTSTTMTVSWDPLPDAEQYLVSWRAIGWSGGRGQIDTKGTTVTFEDLRPGRKYEVSLWVRYKGSRDIREAFWRQVTTGADAPVTPTLTISGGTAVSEGGYARFTITASPAPTSTISVALTVTQNGDFAAGGSVGTRTRSISGRSTIFYVGTDDDSADESHGSISVRLNGRSQYRVGSTSSATVIVLDNDNPPPAAPSVSIAAGAGVTEGAAASFTVSASPAPSSPLSVSLVVSESGSFASNGATGTKSVTIPTSGSATYTVATVDDGADEPNGSISVRVAGGSGYSVGSPFSASVAVADNDNPPAATPSVTISAGAGVTEGSSASFTISASPAPASPLAVSLIVSESGSFASNGATGTKSVTIPTSGSATYSVATVNDSADEPNGSISVRVAGGNGYSVGSPFSASVAVADNDDPPAATPSVTISAGAGVTEGAAASFTVSASPAPASPLSVSLVVSESGSFAPNGATGTKSVTIPTSGSATYTVATVDDSADEPHGSISVRVASGSGYSVGSSSTASVTVSDNDDPPAKKTCNTTDAALLGQVEAKVTRHTTSGRTDLKEMFSSALDTMKGKGSYTVAKLRARPDKQHANWDRPGPNALWQAVYTELDRLEACRGTLPPQPAESTPVVTISAGGGITEGGSARFTVTATPAPSSPLTVTLTVSQSGDFAASGATGAKTVSVPTSGSVPYSVATVNDTTDEVDGSVSVAVASGNGYTVGSTSAATVSVSDNDAALPSVSIQILTSGPITEGQSVRIRLTASPAPKTNLPVVVDVDAGAQFRHAAGGISLTMLRGRATYDFNARTIDDDVYEGDGPLTLSIRTSPVHQLGAPQSVTIQVRDNDPAPPVSVSVAAVANTVSEGAPAQFTLTSTPAPAADLMVKIDLIERGGYIASTDPITVVIPKGDTTKTFTVPTIDDQEIEGSDGTVTAKVWAMQGQYAAGDPMMATVNVHDNDDNKVIILPSRHNVREGQPAVFNLLALRPPSQSLTVTYDVSYSGAGNRVTAQTGQTATITSTGKVNVSIPTTTGGTEGVGTITVTLTSVSDSTYELGTPTTAQMKVGEAVDYDVDNDGLIDINTLHELNAIRWDTDGDGAPDTYVASTFKYLPEQTWTDHERVMLYTEAFPYALDSMGCPSTGCKGFELKRNLDFDTSGDGYVNKAGDAFWNDGKGWLPIAGVGIRDSSGQVDHCLVTYNMYGYLYPNCRGTPKWPFAFRAIFEGNGYTIKNLYVNDIKLMGAGLFGYSATGSVIRNVGLTVTPNSGSMVRGHRYVGALGGYLRGDVLASYANVDVSGRNKLGGLIGFASGDSGSKLLESYATGDVTGVSGYHNHAVGGLVGRVSGILGIVGASFASGEVNSNVGDAGGLFGDKWSRTIAATYATGDVNHRAVPGLTNYPGSGGFIGDVVYNANYRHGKDEPLTAGYSIGRVGRSDRKGANGGSVADCTSAHAAARVYNVYWDVSTSGRTNSTCNTKGYTTTQLQTPTDYDTAQTIDGTSVKIYEHWNVDVDGDGTADDPWDFGTASQYPILKYCADKGDIENTAALKDYNDKSGKEYCPLREVLQHGRKPTIPPVSP